MTQEELVIAAVRVAGSLLVLRWALGGAIVAILVDFSDLFLRNLLDLGGVRDYQAFDKWLDQVYMLAFLVVALRWHGPARTIALGFFAFRLVGFAAFEVTGERSVLLAFPNLFEVWFLFVASLPHWWGRLTAAPWAARAVAASLGALKGLQEFALHQGRWLDTFTAVEAVRAVWRWLTP